MDTNALIGKVITRSHSIDKLLQKHFPTTKGGLFAALNALGDTLPAVLARSIRTIGVVRNAAAHPDGFKAESVPSDFDRLCNEIELLIPYFAAQLPSKSVQPSKKEPKSSEPKVPSPKPSASVPSAHKPSPLKPPASKPMEIVAAPRPPSDGGAAVVPANYGNPWTPEEDAKLVEGFDAQMGIPELAKTLQRGIGSVQNRLVKLWKVPADHYKPCPPESD